MPHNPTNHPCSARKKIEIVNHCLTIGRELIDASRIIFSFFVLALVVVGRTVRRSSCNGTTSRTDADGCTAVIYRTLEPLTVGGRRNHVGHDDDHLPQAVRR